jgi:hypothetical protein
MHRLSWLQLPFRHSTTYILHLLQLPCLTLRLSPLCVAGTACLYRPTEEGIDPRKTTAKNFIILLQKALLQDYDPIGFAHGFAQHFTRFWSSRSTSFRIFVEQKAQRRVCSRFCFTRVQNYGLFININEDR